MKGINIVNLVKRLAALEIESCEEIKKVLEVIDAYKDKINPDNLSLMRLGALCRVIKSRAFEKKLEDFEIEIIMRTPETAILSVESVFNSFRDDILDPEKDDFTKNKIINKEIQLLDDIFREPSKAGAFVQVASNEFLRNDTSGAWESVIDAIKNTNGFKPGIIALVACYSYYAYCFIGSNDASCFIGSNDEDIKNRVRIIVGMDKDTFNKRLRTFLTYHYTEDAVIKPWSTDLISDIFRKTINANRLYGNTKDLIPNGFDLLGEIKSDDITPGMIDDISKCIRKKDLS